MTAQEYENIQYRLTCKLNGLLPREMKTGRRREGYEAGIRAAKSIIKELFEKETEK